MKKILCLVVFETILFLSSYVLASTYIPCSQSETQENTCFQCGAQCSARISYPTINGVPATTNATLTFSGTGDMYNYGSPHTDDPSPVAPWWPVHDQIKKVVIEEGLTSLGARTVYEMDLTEINLPESLETIKSYAFYGSHISSLSIPKNVTSISPGAFGSGSQYNESIYLDNLSCDESIKSQCEALLARWDENINLSTSMQYGNQYFLNGKFYQNVNDMMSNTPLKKRIYTIDEANLVSKPTGNTIRIKYR